MSTIARTFKRVRSIVLLFSLALFTLPVTATDFITDVMLIGAGNKQDLESLKSKYSSQGWKILDKDFNAGIDWGKGDGILLLYKTATSTDGYNHGYITDLYLQNRSAANTTNTLDFNGRTYNLVPFDGSNHFKDVKGDLNSGTGSSTDAIHLYYTKEHFADNRAITAIFINGNSGGAVGREGNTKSGYNLNAGCSKGENIFLHASTATAPFKDCYFTDVMLIGAGSSSELESVKATYTSQGWKVIDYDLNKGIDWGKGDAIYLLYKAEISPDGLNHNYITDFYLQNKSAARTTDYIVYRNRQYPLVPYDGSQHFKDVKGDLNSGTGESTDDIHLYYTRSRNLGNGTTITGIFFNDNPNDSITVGKEGDLSPYDLNSGCTAFTSEKIHLHYTVASTWKKLSPIGDLTVCEIRDRSVYVKGWAYDPDESSEYVNVVVEIRHSSKLESNTFNHIFADKPDEDVNKAHGIIGKHGFEASFPIRMSGTCEVNVTAIDITGDDFVEIGDTNKLTITGSCPISAIEAFEPDPRGISIRGWAYDPDVPDDSSNVKVYIQNIKRYTPQKIVTLETDQKRTDINARYGINGNHGFNSYISITDVPAGTYNISVYACDNTGEKDTLIYEKSSFTITRTMPVSSLEKLEESDEGLQVQGWAYDPDDSGKAIPIRVEIKRPNGSIYKTWNLNATDITRDDINSRFNITGKHGFRKTFLFDESGTFKVSVYAKDVTDDSEVQIGITQTVTVSKTLYNLWVGGTQVTSFNKQNILNQTDKNNNPTAWFDPETNTLTLNEPIIEKPINQPNNEKYVINGIYAQDMDLVIKGKYHNDEEYVQYKAIKYAICVDNGDLTLDGDFLLHGYSSGVCLDAYGSIENIENKGNLIILGGSVICKGLYGYGIDPYGELLICGNVKRVEAYGETRAIAASSITVPGHRITTPAGGSFSPDLSEIYETDGKTHAKHVVFEKKNESYKVWIGSKQVTSDIWDNVFGDGKVSFNPETNTLTLNNPKIDGYHTFDGSHSAVIYTEIGDLNLKGSFKQVEATTQYCIATSGGDLSTTGEFALPGTIAGVWCKTLNVKNGTTSLALTGGEKASQSASVVMEDWLKSVSPDKIIKNGQFYESDGTTPAKQVTITGFASDPYYNLWLGYTQVTGFNKDNILNQTDGNGEPTAKYDPQTCTLTLNNPDIIGSNGYSKICSSIKCLTITGTFHMTEAATKRGIFGSSALILSGDFTFKGTESGIDVMGGITVQSGTLKAIGERIGLYARDTNIKKDVKKVELEGGEFAIELMSYSQLNFEGTQGISTPLYGYQNKVPSISVNSIYDSDNNIARKVVIEPGYRAYRLWVGSQKVTAENLNDILGDGRASFNPEDNTLTLNEPFINSYHIIEEGVTAAIYAERMDITVKGQYHMTHGDDDADFGIMIKSGSVFLDGDFELYGNNSGVCTALNLSCVGRAIKNPDDTPTSDGDVSLNGNITLYGGRYGISSGGKTTLSGTCIIKGGYTGLFSNCMISVNDGALVTIEHGSNMAIQCIYDKMIVSGGIRGIVIKGGQEIGDFVINNDFGQDTQILSPDSCLYSPAHRGFRVNDKAPRSVVIGTAYNLCFGGIWVTSLNKDDILNDGGKARFEPEAKTLILNSPEITDLDNNIYGALFLLYSSDTVLTIKGEYHMAEPTPTYGVLMNGGDLILDGDFSFYGKTTALVCYNGKLTVKSGKTNSVRLQGGQEYKTLLATDLELDKGMVVKEPSNYIFSQTKMTIINADWLTTATTIVISYDSKDDENNTTKVESARPGATNSGIDIWYDMYGRKLDGIPTENGLYIINGKTVYLAR